MNGASHVCCSIQIMASTINEQHSFANGCGSIFVWMACRKLLINITKTNTKKQQQQQQEQQEQQHQQHVSTQLMNICSICIVSHNGVKRVVHKVLLLLAKFQKLYTCINLGDFCVALDCDLLLYPSQESCLCNGIQYVTSSHSCHKYRFLQQST
jgi:hypothetical protein